MPARGGHAAPREAARPVERDLETVLADLADDFPLLASLVEQGTGQRRLPVTGPGGGAGLERPAVVRENPGAVKLGQLPDTTLRRAPR